MEMGFQRCEQGVALSMGILMQGLYEFLPIGLGYKNPFLIQHDEIFSWHQTQLIPFS